MHDTIRRDALAGSLLTGTWLSLGQADAVEMAAQAGFDWLLIDHEHGVSDWRELQHQLQAAAAGGSAATVLRVGAVDAAVFKRAFDLGVHGLMVPDVRDAQTALQVVDLSRVPPLGQRGLWSRLCKIRRHHQRQAVADGADRIKRRAGTG